MISSLFKRFNNTNIEPTYNAEPQFQANNVRESSGSSDLNQKKQKTVEKETQQQRNSTMSPSTPEEKNNGSTEEKRIVGTGEITALHNGIGIIDRLYRFEAIEFGNKLLKKGVKVYFSASQNDGMWSVDDITVCPEEKPSTPEQKEDDQEGESIELNNGESIGHNSNNNNNRNQPSSPVKPLGDIEYHMCQVTAVQEGYFFVEFNKETVTVQKSLFAHSSCVLVGDWLKMGVKIKGGPFDKSIEEIKSINWTERGIRVGKLVKESDYYLVEDIFIPPIVLEKNTEIGINDRCRVTYVLSDRQKSNKTFRKRCIRIESITNQKDVQLDSESLQELFRSKHNLIINPSQMDLGTLKINSTIKGKFEVLNKGTSRVILQSVLLKGDQGVCEFQFNISNREGKSVLKTLDPGDSVELQIECTPKLLGHTTEICVFNFSNCVIGRKISIKATVENPASFPSLHNSQNFFTSKKARQNVCNKSRQGLQELLAEAMRKDKLTYDRGPKSVRAPFFLPAKLPEYPLPEEIVQVYASEKMTPGTGAELLLEKFPNVDWTTLTQDNHTERFHISLYLEELECKQLRKSLDLKNEEMKKDYSEKLMFFRIPSSTDTKPVRQGERVHCSYSSNRLNLDDFVEESSDSEDSSGNLNVSKKNKDLNENKSQIRNGYIHKILSQEVYVKFSDQFFEEYDGQPVDISFLQSRRHFRKQLHSVQESKRLLGKEWLFPTEETAKIKPPKIMFLELESSEPVPHKVRIPKAQRTGENNEINVSKPMVDTRIASQFAHQLRIDIKDEPIVDAKLEWFNPILNSEQKDAVRRVLRGQCRPLPYIIFGPPGTGKTVTLIECVRQVNKMDRQSRILIAVPSNQAGDLIAERLAATNDYAPGDFVRFNGFLRSPNTVPEKIRRFCYDGEKLNSVVKHRIIIATISTAGQFLGLNINPGHFTHVFIDEAGFATEPETLLACIMTAVDKQGQVILAGDPCQLVPTLYHNSELHKILRRSLLERFMMDTPVYSYNVEKEGYNSAFITMFTRSYRLPELLLKISSRLFYHDILMSEKKLDEELLETLESQGILKNREPLLFHGLRSQSTREDSHSWGNDTEAQQCVIYVQKLKQAGLKDEEIGIISLYRKQVEKIKNALRDVDCYPKVATIHEFQGGEKRVIIVSTVISFQEIYSKGPRPSGFLYNAKIFNVAITRASAALIIIGDPHILHKTPWKAILEFSLNLGVYKGCNLPLDFEGLENIDGVSFDQAEASDNHEQPPNSNLVDQSPGNVSKDSDDLDSDDEDDSDEWGESGNGTVSESQHNPFGGL